MDRFYVFIAVLIVILSSGTLVSRYNARTVELQNEIQSLKEEIARVEVQCAKHDAVIVEQLQALIAYVVAKDDRNRGAAK